MADFRTTSGKRAATGCADAVLPLGVVPAALVSLTTVGWAQLLVAGGTLGLPRGPRRGASGTRPNFQERRACEVRSSPGPREQKFSGSWSVTSRNPLLHNGATNATWSPRFGSEVVLPCRSRGLRAALGGSLATANFRE